MSSSRTQSGSESLTTEGKFPLKRLEVAIHRIIGVAIPLHLDILSKQKENIHKCQLQKQWEKLHMEQLNASRTVQQLRADLQELDNVRNQVSASDIATFDQQVSPARNDVLQRTQSFTDMLKLPADTIFFQTSPATDINGIPLCVEGCEMSKSQQQHPVLAVEIPSDTTAFQSWTKLHKDLIDLNAVVHSFSHLVLEQKEDVSSIAEHITEAEENVLAGTNTLGKAAKLQKAVLPVTLALVGIALGGPVGLIVGVKTGLACALGGSILGFKGGRALQYRQSDSETVRTPSEGIELKDLPKATATDLEQKTVSHHKDD